MTSLVHEVWRGNIADVSVDSQSPNLINIYAVIPASAGPFTIREMAAYTDDGKMIAVANCPDIDKVAADSGAIFDVSVGMQILLDNTGTLNVMVDPTVAIASKKYVDDKFKELADDLGEHTGDTDIHITAEEREKWNKTSSGKKGLIISDTKPNDQQQDLNGLWFQPVSHEDEEENDYRIFIKTAEDTYIETNFETAAKLVIHSDGKTSEEKCKEFSSSISDLNPRIMIASHAEASEALITLTLPDTPKLGSLVTFQAPAAALDGAQVKIGETTYPVHSISGEPVKAKAWTENSMVTISLGQTNAYLQGGGSGEISAVYSVTLSESGWIQDPESKIYRQAINIPGLTSGDKVDLDCSVTTLDWLNADIIPENAEGVLNALTYSPPAADIQVQATVYPVEVIASGGD